MDTNNIELAEMIGKLRGELQKAQTQGQDEDLKFRIGDIEVELQIGVTREAGAKGGVKFWVYNAEAEGKLASETVQKLRLKLKPEYKKGDFKVADKGKKPKD